MPVVRSRLFGLGAAIVCVCVCLLADSCIESNGGGVGKGGGLNVQSNRAVFLADVSALWLGLSDGLGRWHISRARMMKGLVLAFPLSSLTLRL